MRSRLGVPGALVLAMLLSACLPPFDALLPPPFVGGAFPGETNGIIIVNETDDDWILSINSDFGPMAYAVPAGVTGEAVLFGAVGNAVRLLDRDCAEVDEIGWNASLGAVAIERPGTLRSLDDVTSEDATTLVEYWECALGAGLPPAAENRLDDASGSILLTGQDGAVWVLDAAAGELASLVEGTTTDGEISVSPDGTFVAFTRISTDDFMAQVVLARIDGTDERVLAEDGFGPVFSPDGSQVAFVDLDPFAGGGELTVVDVEGGEPRRIASDASAPRWSPDGSQIAFSAVDAESLFGEPMAEPSELQIIRADGTGLRTLAEGSAYGQPPAWSPDGTMIAFTGPENGGSLEGETAIQVVTIADGKVKTMAELDGAALSEPAWSPDGERLAFSRFAFGFFAATAGIGVVGSDGGTMEEVTSDDSAFYSGPTWSPDGRWIAAVRVSNTDFAADLVAIDVASGQATVLASEVLDATAWIPNQLLD